MAPLDHRRSLRRTPNAIGADLGPAHISELNLIVWQALKTARPHITEDADVGALINRDNERIGQEVDWVALAR